MKRLLLVAALSCALPCPAFAQETGEIIETTFESERSFVFEFNVGRYFPEVDSEAGLNGRTPYYDLFAGKALWLIDGELDYELFQQFGVLGIGFAGSFGKVGSKGLYLDETPSPDSTALKLIPLRLLATYRFDWLSRHLGIPLVPFAKAGPAYTFWWVTDGSGDIVKFTDEDGVSRKARGGKWGYELAAGLAFELDFLDPSIAREFDADWGVNSAFLTAQFMRLVAESGGGMILSDSTWLFGLGLEF